MASTLPAIKVGGQVTQQVIRTMPSPPTKGSSSIGSPLRSRGTNQFDGLYTRGSPRQELRKQPSGFEKIDTARHRNSYEHNLCLDMLKDGFHQSFCELFNLMQGQKEERDRLGADSGLADRLLLEDEPEKLDQLKHHLTSAEAARRRGKMDQVYHSLLALARYFEETGDQWLSDHFYASLLKTSLKIRGDGRRKESEANCNMGLALERKGDLLKAAQFLESFHSITKGRLWQTDSGENLHVLSCEHLRRVYTSMSEQVKEEDMEKSIEFLLKAYEMAKESGDTKQEGLASYRLGIAHEEIGDAETAILYHNGYLEKCQQISDDVGMGRACQALARAYEMQEDVGSAMKYLEMFVELADRAQQLPEQQKACNCLGAIYNSLGKYEDSMRLFRRSFEIAEDLGDTEVIEATRVQYGIAVAHTLLGGYTECMDQVHKGNTQRLLDFKSSRVDTFSSEAQDEAERTESSSEANVDNQQEGDTPPEEPSHSENVNEVSENSEQNVPEGTDSGVMTENIEESQG